MSSRPAHDLDAAEPGVRSCSACGAALGASSRFCPGCGHPTRAGRRAQTKDTRRERRKAQRVVLGFAVSFIGVFAVLFARAEFDELHPLSPLALPLASLALATVGLAGALALGGGAVRASFAGRPTARFCVLGLLGGLLSFGMSLGYVARLNALVVGAEVGEAALDGPPVPLGYLFLEMVLVAALLEEWICRGVLWEAARRATTVPATLFLTSALFALMHFFNGGLFLELPNRFAMGLVFGYLRHRTGSLVPAIAAHALNNTLAIVVGV